MKLYIAAALGMISVLVLTAIEYSDSTEAALIRDKGTDMQARILVAEIEQPGLLDYPEPATMDILYAFQPAGMEVQTGFGSIPLTGDRDEAALVKKYHEGASLAIRYLKEDVHINLPVDGLDDNARFSWVGLSLDFAAVLVVLIAAIVQDILRRRKNSWPNVGMASAYRGTRLRDVGRGSPYAYEPRTSGPEKIRFGKRC